MPKPYSEDLRERVIRDVKAGATRREVVAKYRVSISFFGKLVQRWRATGSYAAKPVGGIKAYVLAEHKDLLGRLVTAEPDITLEELRSRLAEKKIKVGRSSIDRFLKAQGLSYKKNGTRQRTGAGGRGRRA